MPDRLPKNDAASDQFKLEFGGISSRIHTAMKAIVPDDWEKARLVVIEAHPMSDEFLEFAEPLHNPADADIIEPLPEELLQAIEDLYLLFFPYQRSWDSCAISLEPSPSGNSRMFRTRFTYPENNTEEDIPF